MKQCCVVATTVYRTYLRGQVTREFDVVIVDEASMLMLPMTFYAAGLAQQSVVIAGDFRQLAPIVTSDKPTAKEWLARDAFEQSGIPQAAERGEKVPHLVTLRTQYRMHEDICAVVNELFYHDSPLKTPASVKTRKVRSFAFGQSPLLYVDTSALQPWSALQLGSHSRYNLMHAILIRNIAVHLKEQGYLDRSEKPEEALGIVAPYVAQTRLLRAMLQDKMGPDGLKLAATVFRFQGNEKDTMLVDLTDSFGTWLGRFMKATNREEQGARLLNVAISRAREHSVLIANFDYLKSHAPRSGFTQRLLQHFQDHGEPLDAEELFLLRDEGWFDGLSHLRASAIDFDAEAAGAFTGFTFYPAFRQDLADVQESLVIFSPFLTERGCSRWIEYFRAAIARGKMVRVVSRPPGDQGGILDEGAAEVVVALRDIGVVVDLRARMHEKIAIVDRKVLWHGSLNILSHRDTSESMLRIPGKAACEQMIRLVSTPLGGRERTQQWGETENPVCQTCGSPMIWKNGRYGIYFECEVCDVRINARDVGRTVRTQRGESSSNRVGTPCPTSGCTGTLKSRSGRHGRFLGCSNYPRCNYTEDA